MTTYRIISTNRLYPRNGVTVHKTGLTFAEAWGLVHRYDGNGVPGTVYDVTEDGPSPGDTMTAEDTPAPEGGDA